MPTMEDLKQKIEQLEVENKTILTLQDLSRGILTKVNLEGVLQRSLDLMVEKLNYRTATIFVYDKETNSMAHPVVAKSPMIKTVQKLWRNKAAGITLELNDKKNYSFKAVNERKIYLSHDLYDFTRPKLNKTLAKATQKAFGINTMMTIPVVIFDEVMGALALGTKNEIVTDAEKQSLQLFANQVGIAMYNARLFSKIQTQVNTLEAQANDLEALHDLSTMAGKSLKKEKVLQELLDNIPRKLGHLGVLGGAIILDQESFEQLHIGFYTSVGLSDLALGLLKKAGIDPGKNLTIGRSQFLRNTATTQKIQIDDNLHDMFPDSISKRVGQKLGKLASIKLYAAAPIIIKRSVQGFMLFALDVDKEQFDRRHREILQVFVNHIAVTLENTDLFEKLQQQYLKVENQRKALAVANSRLKELDNAKSEFISIASHQLRTPLTVIKGYLSMVMDGDVGKCDKLATQQLEKIISSADRLVRLVNDLLDVSRIERGKLVVDMKKIRLEKVAQSVVEQMNIQAEKKGLKLYYEHPKKHLPFVNADSHKITEVMMNIIDNAIKYTEKGHITARLRRDGQYIVFEVIDTGMGFSEETKHKLFEKFSRADDVSTIHTEGLGLGLYVVKKIIDIHQGFIQADSAGPGLGSTFRFKIPVYKK